MKKIGKFLILVLAVSLFAATSSKAQVYVPTPPAAVQKGPSGTRPNKYMVWVPEEWAPAGDKYIYRAGYWAFPPTPKSVYVPGHWEKTPKGYIRRPGYWNNPHI